MKTKLFHALGFFILSVLTFTMFSCIVDRLPVSQNLNENWTLNVDAAKPELEVIVPGTVHTDLLSANLIEDPFFGNVESDLQWVGNRIWEYQLHLAPDNQILENEHVQLIFEGLDTYAEVFLNEKLLFQANNMFRTYELPVKDQLINGDNILRIRFFSPDSINAAKAKSYPYKLPDERAFMRKAPYHFGWDWGPKYVTMGIWKTVKLMAWNNVRLTNAVIHQLNIDSKLALLELDVEIESSENRSISLKMNREGQQIVQKKVKLETGINRIIVPFEIKNPHLWWPKGMGEQKMHIFDIQIYDRNELVETRQIKTGLRSIELVQEEDDIGTSFYFKVNEQPVFMKGANYIPEDNFPTRVSREKTRKLLTDAAAVNMNMIRVWGGGIYPNDDFYELCDSLGLLVWQDFMFACTMYPFDEEFLENVKYEAIDQVKRLANHPSLALWCGNNEISEGFHNWGWQKALNWTKEDENAIWDGYQQLFEKLLPEVIQQYDSQRIYWPSSPSKGWGRSESLTQGDVHYWGVWWGEEPFEMYETKVGRFHSEYGFQAMPNITSLNEFTTPENRYLSSPELEAHQKHPKGTALIDLYMNRYFPVPTELNKYVYMSQLVQAYGISKAIEAQRRNRPITMGTLYWQLNDCWPVTSWSSIDYYGRWKALHYQLKDLYAPILISLESKNDSLRLFAINDNNENVNARLEIDLKDMHGNVLRSYTENVVMEGNTSKILKTFLKSQLLAGIDTSAVFLHSRLMDKDLPLVEKVTIFVKPKNLKLIQNQPNMSVYSEKEKVKIQLKSDVLIKDLMLYSNDANGFFENNFFDLIPGKTKEVIFIPSELFSKDELKFGMLMLNDIQ